MEPPPPAPAMVPAAKRSRGSGRARRARAERAANEFFAARAVQVDPNIPGRLRGSELARVVREEVTACPAIDVHTHLFPGQHGDLLLWGIDELLTYHYLVSEMFMVAPATLTHEDYFALPKSKQAALVWQYLFVDRSPLSEAQLGVLTTLQRLGLGEYVAAKDLPAIQNWFASQNPLTHTDVVFGKAKLKYVVMTNIPFDEREASCWVRPEAKIDPLKEHFAEDAKVKQQTFCSVRFRTAMRIDPLLKGDWGTICACLVARGLPETLAGARTFLRAWAKVYSPEYLMASTPADFQYGPEDAPRAEGWPTATQLIDEVMAPIAMELNLPLAMKLGAKRGMNPALNPCGGGDGVVVADVTPLENLCRKYPTVKFLATFLSRVNQHEVCVLAQKFRNLHIYGCWWYCNNPSMVDEITRMRLEMLHTGFTAQHSDARVLDQLVYKWDHNRRLIADAMVRQYAQLDERGWPVTAADVRRDVWRLLGGSYEEFMAKDLRDATPSVEAPPPPPSVPQARLKRLIGRNFAQYCMPGIAGCGC